MWRLLAVAGALAAVGATVVMPQCPAAKDIRPCTCDGSWYCDRAGSGKELAEAFRRHHFSAGAGVYSSFFLRNSRVEALRPRTFGTAQFREMYITNNSALSVVDETAFQGLEDSLTYLDLSHNSMAGESVFRALAGLRHVAYLTLDRNSLEAVPGGWAAGAIYRTVNLRGNRIASIGRRPFAALRLDRLDLRDNQLQELTLDVLDADWQSHSVVLLQGNRISRVVPGVFSRLHPTSHVVLSGNRLGDLPEDVFRPFLESLHPVGRLVLTDNPVQCDCRLRWLVKVPGLRSRIEGLRCPDGRNVANLSLEDFKNC